MSKKLMIIITPVIVLIICCLGVLLFIPEEANTHLYLQQLQKAEKYVETGDYEQAITYYKAAIEADKTQDTPYIQIANLYYELGDLENAIKFLRDGVAQSGTDKIKNVLQKYLEIEVQNTDETVNNNIAKGISFNSDLLNKLDTYTFETYSKTFTVKTEGYMNGAYSAKYLNIDAEFLYKDNNDLSVIDKAKSKPYNHIRPTEILINNIDLLFNENVDVVSSEELRSYGASNVKTKYDSKEKAYFVTFTYLNSKFQLECNEKGIIVESKHNKMFPPVTEEKATETKTVSTSNIDVVFAVDVSGSMMYDLDTAKQAVNSFIDALDEKDRAGLVQFNGYSQILSDLTADKNSLKSKVASLSASGGTSIYSGLNDSLNVFNNLDNNDSTYKMIIILSDGYDSVSSYESVYSGLINTAVNNNIVVYTVGIGSTVDTNLLTNIASDTKGGYYHANDASEIIKIFDDIQNEEVVVTNNKNMWINTPLKKKESQVVFSNKKRLIYRCETFQNFYVKCV